MDKDSEWRDGEAYTRDESETIISHPEIAMDRRVYYACMLLGGMRPGVIAALRVRHYDAKIEPLGRLTVALALNTRKNVIKGTKTNAVRHVPVHPTLAAMLGEWLLSGFATQHGRAPEPGDLLLPLPPEDAAQRRTREGEPVRTGDYACKKWREVDLPMLGIRARTMYAMKSTFISLCEEDGADPEIIESRVTHTKQSRTAYRGYVRRSATATASRWAVTCGEVAKLRIARRRVGGKLAAMR